MKSLDDLKVFCAAELPADCATLEALRKRASFRFGRFFGWSVPALFVGFGVASATKESLGGFSVLFALVPTLWLFLGFIVMGIISAARWRRVNEAYVLGPGLKALQALLPGAVLDASGRDRRNLKTSGLYAKFEGIRAEVSYQLTLSGRRVRLMAGNAHSGSRSRPRATLLEFPLSREWRGSFAVRRKNFFLKAAEQMLGTEIFPHQVDGRRMRRRTWPDHEPFDTGHGAFDAEFHCLRSKQGPNEAPPTELLEGLLKLAQKVNRPVFFGVAGDRAALVIEGFALFWPEDRVVTEPVSPEKIAEVYHRDAALALELAGLPGLPLGSPDEFRA